MTAALVQSNCVERSQFLADCETLKQSVKRPWCQSVVSSKGRDQRRRNIEDGSLEFWSSELRRTSAIPQKTHKENLEKGRGLGRVTPINFGVHPNVSPNRVELETWNLVHRRTAAIPQKPAKKNRGLGHVTPINYGVHPNVSPKRVELETWNLVHRRIGQYSKTRKEKSKKVVAEVTWSLEYLRISINPLLKIL